MYFKMQSGNLITQISEKLRKISSKWGFSLVIIQKNIMK